MDNHVSHMCLNSSSTSILEALSTWASILAVAPHAWLSLDLHQVFSNMEKNVWICIPSMMLLLTTKCSVIFQHNFCWRSRPSESQPRLQTAAPCGRRWSHLSAHPRWPNNHRHPATWDFVHIASPLESHEYTPLPNKKQWLLGLKSAWNGLKW